MIILGILFQTNAFACIVNDDGTHDCANQPRPEQRDIYINKANEINILENYMKESEMLIVKMKNICREERKAYKINKSKINKNKLRKQCLCKNPNIAFSLKQKYNELMSKNPEWKESRLSYEVYSDKDKKIIQKDIEFKKIKQFIIKNELDCK